MLVEASGFMDRVRELLKTAPLDAELLDDLVTRYRALAAAGLAANLYRRTATARDTRRVARRFLSFEDLILRFAVPALTWTFSPITKRKGQSGRSRPSSAPQEAHGAPSKGSPTSRSSSPTCPSPANGASANSTPSATCSTAAHGSRPASNPPADTTAPALLTSRSRVQIQASGFAGESWPRTRR
jgi:hypothetical protein